jgi:hypothetical protein
MAMNYTSGNFPFYNPSQSYGWNRDYRYEDSPLGQTYLNDIAPEGAYTRWMAEQGYGDFGNNTNVVRGLYGRNAAGYAAAQGTNSDLTWTNYLKTVDPRAMLLSMTPDQRGEHGGAGRMRWAPRS